MIKCFFVDVKSIKSKIPKAKFKKTQIEKIADSILAIDGLLSPLLIQQTGSEEFTVIQGDLEYHAAVRAKEKDSSKAEMVNAFVIPANHCQAAIEQIILLSGTQPTPSAKSKKIAPSSAEIDNDLFDRLNINLVEILSQQLQPLQQQLDSVRAEIATHTQILSSLVDRVATTRSTALAPAPSTSPLPTIADRKIEPSAELTATSQQQSIDPEILPPIVQEPTIPAPTKTTQSKTKSASTKRKSTTPASAIETKPQKSSVPAKTKSTNSPTNTKIKADPIASFDTERLKQSLQLINTLDLQQLTLSMSRSTGLSDSDILAANIIAKRDTQPEQKFDTWQDLLDAKVAGLITVKIKKIIEKLK